MPGMVSAVASGRDRARDTRRVGQPTCPARVHCRDRADRRHRVRRQSFPPAGSQTGAARDAGKRPGRSAFRALDRPVRERENAEHDIELLETIAASASMAFDRFQSRSWKPAVRSRSSFARSYGEALGEQTRSTPTRPASARSQARASTRGTWSAREMRHARFTNGSYTDVWSASRRRQAPHRSPQPRS